jgi:peptidoglycan/LPS O-acetylase OafA/YrhL
MLLNKRIEGLDVLRGFTALYVMVFHINEFGCIYIYEGIFKSIISYGYIGVPIFFIISGFSLSYATAKSSFFSEKGIYSFYIKRFFRILPLFYLALIIHLLLNTLLLNKPFNLSETLLTCSFLFPFFNGHQESLVLAGWSLGVEMIFYIFFPFFLILKNNKYALYLLTIVSSYIFLHFSTHNNGTIEKTHYFSFGYNLIFFTLGILYYFLIFDKKIKLTKWLSLFVFILGVFILLFGIIKINSIHFKYFELSGVALLTLGSIFMDFKFFINPITKLMGNLSYSIYLLHPIIIIIFLKTKMNIYISTFFPNFGFLIYMLAIAFTVVLLSALTYYFFEKYFINRGKKIVASLNSKDN